jgi:putative aminopeptidase FrvX
MLCRKAVVGAALLMLGVVQIVMPARPQTQSLKELVEQLFPIPASTGNEQPMVEAILGRLPDQAVSSQDNLGSLYLHSLSESLRLTILTGMDEIGYVVSGITDEGFLTLDRGVSPPHSLYDTYQFGHHVTVWARNGPLRGVWVLPSAHTLSAGRRRALMQEMTLDNAYVDIGASSRKQVELRGVAYLDPVTPAAEIHALAGNQLSGPSLGTKACTAVLLDMAREAGDTEDISGVQFVWLAQSKLVRRGRDGVSAMGAVRAARAITSPGIVIIDIYPCAMDVDAGISPGLGPVLVGDALESELYARLVAGAEAAEIPVQEAEGPIPAVMASFSGENRDVVGVLLPVKFAHTPSEVVRMQDLEHLRRLVLAAVPEGGIR